MKIPVIYPVPYSDRIWWWILPTGKVFSVQHVRYRTASNWHGVESGIIFEIEKERFK